MIVLGTKEHAYNQSDEGFISYDMIYYFILLFKNILIYSLLFYFLFYLGHVYKQFDEVLFHDIMNYFILLPNNILIYSLLFLFLFFYFI